MPREEGVGRVVLDAAAAPLWPNTLIAPGGQGVWPATAMPHPPHPPEKAGPIPHAERSHRTRRLFLDVGRALFTEQGSAQTSVEAIVRPAGVPPLSPERFPRQPRPGPASWSARWCTRALSSSRRRGCRAAPRARVPRLISGVSHGHAWRVGACLAWGRRQTQVRQAPGAPARVLLRHREGPCRHGSLSCQFWQGTQRQDTV